MNLEQLEWGDVIHQGDGLLVCEAVLEGELVVAKRWQEGILDDEQCARRLLAGASVPGREVLGGGDGWMVLEDLTQSMWRPAGAGDLEDAAFLGALAAWLVQVHQVEPVGLSSSVGESLLDPQVTAAAAALSGTSPGQVEALRAHVARVLGEGRPTLVLGGFDAADLWVLGGGLRAMSDDLQDAHAGHPAEDLHRLRAVLGSGWDAFLAAYRDRSGLDSATVEGWLQAGEARAVLLRWVARCLSGSAVDPELAQQLQNAIVTCCCR